MASQNAQTQDEICFWPMVFHGKDIRTAIDERDKSVWVHGGDVCSILGIANASDGISRIKSEHKREIGITDSIGRKQNTPFLSRRAVYRLAFTSRKPEAEEFTDRVTDLLEQLRDGKLELRPRAQGLTEHVEYGQQKENSKALNRRAYTEGGKEEVKRQNAWICYQLSDKHLYPSQYKQWAQQLGWPAKERGSGQEVLRKLEPWSACACSLVKNLLAMGVPNQDALVMAEQQKAFFAQLLRYASPKELVEADTAP